MGVHREKRGSRSSCFAEIKLIDEGIRAIQYLRHLMKQLGLPDVDVPTPLLNNNQGSIDRIESGCKPTKKLQHENLSELGIYEARLYNEVDIYWTPGPTNLVDIFTKEDKDAAHFESVRDQMVMPRESIRLPVKAKSWGVLERRLDDPNYDSLTQLTKRKEQKEMNDVSVVDSKVRIKDTVGQICDSTVQSNDTNNDTDNDTSNDNYVTWSNHAQQRTYSDGDDITLVQQSTYGDEDEITLVQQSTYGDGNDTIDISETITSVKKPYIYKSYKDACSGSKKPCSESTVTYGRNPHHISNHRQVTSE